MLSCDQATFLMSQRAERPLSFRERLQLSLHVAMCSGCRLFGRQVDVLGRLAREYAPGRDEPKA